MSLATFSVILLIYIIICVLVIAGRRRNDTENIDLIEAQLCDVSVHRSNPTIELSSINLLVSMGLDDESNYLIKEKPDGWEYLVFAHQIREIVGRLRESISSSHYNVGSYHLIINNTPQCLEFCKNKVGEVLAAIKSIGNSETNYNLEKAFEKARETGDPEPILNQAAMLINSYKALLVWKSEIESVKTPDQCKNLLALLYDFGKPALESLEEYCLSLHDKIRSHIDKVDRGENPENLTLKYTLAVGDSTKYIEEFDRLSRIHEIPINITVSYSPIHSGYKDEEYGEFTNSKSEYVYDYWIPLEEYSRKVSASLHVKYMKNRGDIVERDFDLQSFRRGPEGYQLHGYCHKRGKARTLVSMGFIECYDRETGEVIPDIKKYVDRVYSSTPTGMFDAVFETHGQEVNILLYLAKVDGSMRAGERGLIADYISNKLGDMAPSVGVIESELKKISPLPISKFRVAVKELARERHESLSELVEMWGMQIAKKRIAHTEETRALNYMKRALNN